MNKHSLGGLGALLLCVAACGETSGSRAEGTDDASVEIPHTEDAGAREDAAAGQGGEQEACSTNSDCQAPRSLCLVAECKSGKCEVRAQDDGFACDDNDACSHTDRCVAGECTGTDRVECAAISACHEVGTCDPQSGECSAPPRSDGTECAIVGICQAGECLEPVVVLARQDFELVPVTPTWDFTGSPVFREGYTSTTAGPPESPIGIAGSRAWETTEKGDGSSSIELANVIIPEGFDSARLRFRLAAMDLTGTGGPDNLDWVLVSLSIDGGKTFYDRLRIRGAATNNSYWGYDATGTAHVAHSPQSEAMFQPTASGLQTTLGYSSVEISFDNSVTQVQVRITARSSSSTDTWLIDDIELTAERDLSAR